MAFRSHAVSLVCLAKAFEWKEAVKKKPITHLHISYQNTDSRLKNNYYASNGEKFYSKIAKHGGRSSSNQF